MNFEPKKNIKNLEKNRKKYTIVGQSEIILIEYMVLYANFETLNIS